ncbi:unnamed protein product, partial [Effrenium voratum]
PLTAGGRTVARVRAAVLTEAMQLVSAARDAAGDAAQDAGAVQRTEVCLQVFGGHHLSGELERLSRGFRDHAGKDLPPRALVYAPQAIKDAGTAQRRFQALKLFLLAPRLLFARCADTGALGKVRLQQKVSDFLAGRSSLLAAAHASRPAGRARAVTGEGLRAGAPGPAFPRPSELAPGNAAAPAALTDLACRPPALRRPVPEDVQPR